MWDLTIRGIDFYHLISWFFIYSFLGWVWETCYVSAKEGMLVNRGFINGPLCTIYGCGALSVYLILKPVEFSLSLLFLGGIVVATVLEYVTAVLMESIFHTSWWDYSDKKFNFQGRICLGASLGWGCFTVILFKVFQPVVVKIVELYPAKVGKIAIIIIVIGYTADFCFSAAAAFHLHERIPAWEQALDEIYGELMLKAHQKMAALEETAGITPGDIRERLEELQPDFRLLKELEEKRASMREDIAKELQKRKEAMAASVSSNLRRFVKSYPNLNRGYRIHKERRFKKKSRED